MRTLFIHHPIISSATLVSLCLFAHLSCTKERDAPPANSAQNAAGGASSMHGIDDTPSSGAASGSGGRTLSSSPDVCGFTEDVVLGPATDDGFVDVPPAHPEIHYSGRIDCQDPAAPTFAHPAVSFRLRFTGSALDLRLKDSGTGTSTTTNHYDVSLDGGDYQKVTVNADTQIYPLARNLPSGEHTVHVVKRTESGENTGKGAFLGFRIEAGGSVLARADVRRRLEFIGDSITCGYGNEVATDDPDSAPYTTANSNANSAYGALTARILGADYLAVAYSGRGIYRNFGGGPGEALPELYGRTLPDQAEPTWDVSRYRPDAIVINLGTNDFSPGGTDPNQYRDAYREFLKSLRAAQPSAVFVLALGPMMSDDYPPGENALSQARSVVQGLVSEFQSAGDADVHYLEFPQQTGPLYGEDWHPTAQTHAKMAELTAEKLRELLGW